MNIGELAAYVCSHLNNNSIECVLSGGACVTIYTDNKYKSLDIDFIDNTDTPRKIITKLLSEIGFKEYHRYFKHSETDFWIEFPPGPLSIGREPIKEINEMKFETGILRLLSPTDCVKDRLSAFYFWEDKQSLKQAKMVAKNYKIDMKEIERWSKIEGKLNIFNDIKNDLVK